MRRELSPLDLNMPKWDASIIDIGRCFNDTNWYIYSVREWKNGETGSIVDFYEIEEDVDSNGNSLYVKEEYRNLGHRDNLYFVSFEIDLLQDADFSELRRQCPLVAEGIIARFVKIDITDRNYPEMFEAYYKMEMTFYAIERKRIDPFSFNVNLEDEFANAVHLRQEQEKIEYSLQHLLPYLKESQHDQIKRTAEAYIAFVKSKATFDEGIVATILVTKPEKEKEIIQLLKTLIKDKSQPKERTMPIRAAMDAGAILRPSWSVYGKLFGYGKNDTWKSAYSKYTNSDHKDVTHPYKNVEAFLVMKKEFEKLIQ